ncbi:MAG: hypothetical protein NTU54_08485 [Candidatus Omnitrophica bacterium]|nr:hypothetical protein [Candidatus Omnitrophota bacterium]
MKLKAYKLSLVNILFIIFGLIFLNLSFLQAGSCPQNDSKDKARLAKYVEVIQGYIQEVRTTIDKAGEGGKEYIAKGLLAGCISLGDYVSLANGAVSPEYANFCNVVKSYADFDNKYAGKAASASGSLPYDDGYSQVFTYEKMGNSPYPIDYSGGNFARKAGQKEAADYAAFLKDRNNALCLALSNYLTQAEQSFVKRLVWNDTGKAPAELFVYAKTGAEFAYNATKQVRKHKVAQAQCHYARNYLFYNAYETYYNACFTSWQGAFSKYVTESSKFSYALWMEITRSNIVRTDWTSYMYKGTSVGHSWDGLNKTMLVTQPAISDYLSQDVISGNVFGTDGNAIEWRGNFDIGAIMSVISQEIDNQHSDPDNALPAKVKDEVMAQAKAAYEKLNKSYAGFKAAQATLVSALNKPLFIDPYMYYLPTVRPFGLNAEQKILPSSSDPKNTYTVLPSNIIEFQSRGNTAPKPNPGNDQSAKFGQTPFTFTLKGSATDAEKDPVSYRWVLTSIPDGGEARSATYVWYQPLSAAQAAQLTPDLAGAWKATLEVTDFQDYDEASVTITAIRHILWISHSDKDIDLALNGNFYLEAAHESSGVYKNFDDNGKPVDLDDSYRPGSSIFCTTAKSKTVEGAYDGDHGSTKLNVGIINSNSPPEVYHKSLGNFTFMSASSKPGSAPINVFGVDKNITQLVLPSSDCPYGNILPHDFLEGTYYIKQWVDNKVWLNLDGKGFKEITKKQPGEPFTPDWMERRSAETLNAFPIVLPYVESINASSDGANNENESGHYNWGGKKIFLNLTTNLLRYNEPVSGGGYGFSSKAFLDDVSRHEAHHAFYDHTHKIEKKWINEDEDDLPGDRAGGMFDYLFDSADNPYGAWGPKPGDAFSFDLVYGGDKQHDNLRDKEFKLKVPLAELAQNPVKKHPLPRNIPISRVDLKSPVMVLSADGKALYGLLSKGTNFTYDIIYTDDAGNIDKTSPIWKIKFDMGKIKALLQEYQAEHPGVNTDGAVILFDYYVHFPHPVYEYDASEIEPGTYVGTWMFSKCYGT